MTTMYCQGTRQFPSFWPPNIEARRWQTKLVSQQTLFLYPEDILWLAGLFTANFCWQLKACPMGEFLIIQIY